MINQIDVVANQRPVPVIGSEEEYPPTSKDSIKEMSRRDVSELERRAEVFKGMHPYILKDKAYILLIICIVLLMLVYGSDIALVNIGLKNSSLLNGTFDLLKFLTSSLIGFIFSQQAIKHK